MATRCLVLLLAAVAAGCSTAPEVEEQRSTRWPSPTPPQPVPMQAPLSSRDYFNRATSLDLFQIRAAEIALQRGTGRVRPLATESKRQHQAIASQLSLAGRRLNLVASRTLPPEYQRMLSQLLSATDFDRVYLAQQRSVSEEALKLHRRYASEGNSPTLRPVARFAVTAVTSELQRL